MVACLFEVSDPRGESLSGRPFGHGEIVRSSGTQNRSAYELALRGTKRSVDLVMVSLVHSGIVVSEDARCDLE